MKIVIYSSSTDFTAEACAFLEKCGHVVMALVATRENLFILVARHTPHFVVSRTSDYTADVAELMHQYYPDIRVITSDAENGNWQECLAESLHSPPAPMQPRPYADDQRVVLHDFSLQKYSGKKKLKRPQRDLCKMIERNEAGQR